MRDYAEQVNRLRNQAKLERYYNGSGKICDEAADAIEELLDELTTIRKQLPHWISVEDALPEIGKFVLVSDGDDIDTACRYKAFTIPDEVETFFWDSVLEVTHWMPLPAPPKEEEW